MDVLNYNRAPDDQKVINYLPEDLIAKIFETLPVKSLVRFRCLSKSWCSHISRPDFIRKHTLRFLNSPKKILIIKQIHNKESNDIYKLLMDNRGMKAVEFCAGNFDIIGSCNGIICLLDDGKRFSLWNFAIRRKLTLPTHSLVEISFNSSCMLVGFGFDPLTQDYKIVCNSLIYSVKMGSWCAFASPATAISDVESQACFFSGALHWVVTSYFSESPTIPHRYILTFNLSSHVFGMISLPESSWEIEQLTIINGLLAVVFSKDNDTWIWVRKESGNGASWSVISKVENIQFELGKVLQTTPNGDLLFFVYRGGCYDVYNPETKEFSGFVELRDCGYFEIDMDTYAESLELLDMGTTCMEIKMSLTEKDKQK